MDRKIVGITGLISSGKDTTADFLCKHYNFEKMSFAGTLKDSVAAVFGWERSLLEGSTPESRLWREEVDEWWAERLDIPQLSPRWVLQYWGTDMCRTYFHNDIWVAALENKLRMSTGNVVISDCRFVNEIQAIKKFNGIMVRVSRGPKPEWHKYAITLNTSVRGCTLHSRAKAKLEAFGIHASEYDTVGLYHDFYIDNTGTFTELHQQIESFLFNASQ